jgi:hypothetical protein
MLSNFRVDHEQDMIHRLWARRDSNKNALAQCMRVSSSFRALAGPLLYEVLDWKDLEKDPLQVVNEGKALRGRNATWLTRNSEVQHIKMINYQPHDATDCCKSGNLIRQGPICVPVLRLSGGQRHAFCRECPLLLDLSPRKVVIVSSADYGYLHYSSYAPSAKVEDLVISINLQQSDVHSFRFKGQARRLVLFLTLANYADGYTYTRLSRDDCFARDMRELAWQVVQYVQTRHSASEVLLVDFARSHENLSVGAETLFEPALKKEVQYAQARIDDRPSDRSYYKSSDEIASVTYDFITMQEYLTNHDWEGVFNQKRSR